MNLHPPFQITPRLLPGLQVGKGWIQLEYCKSKDSSRQGYRWTIDLPDGSEHSGDDLASGCGGGSLQSGFASLLSFLGACAESYSYRQRTGRQGENEDLFPPAAAEWAAQNSDEIDMLALEIEESKGTLIEE